MTHAERQALIRKPFSIVRHGTSYPWAGVLIEDSEQDERGLVANILATKYQHDWPYDLDRDVRMIVRAHER